MLMINLYHTNSGVFIYLSKAFDAINYKTFIINLWIRRICRKRSFKVTWAFTNSPEVAAQRCFVKKAFLKTLQNLQENTCARASFSIKLQVWGQSLFFNKVAGLRPATLLKRILWHWCFSVNFAKSLRTLFLKVHLRWLLLAVSYIYDNLCFNTRVNFLIFLQHSNISNTALFANDTNSHSVVIKQLFSLKNEELDKMYYSHRFIFKTIKCQIYSEITKNLISCISLHKKWSFSLRSSSFFCCVCNEVLRYQVQFNSLHATVLFL